MQRQVLLVAIGLAVLFLLVLVTTGWHELPGSHSLKSPREQRIGNLLLLDAAASGDWSAVDEAIESGADANYVDAARDGVDALMLAAAKGHVQVVQRLVEYSGIELEHRDHSGESALDKARANGHQSVVAVLVPLLPHDGTNVVDSY